MKLVLEKADLQIALVQRLADAYGIEVEAHQIQLPDLEEVAIKIHPATTPISVQTEETNTQKRKRRSRAEIEAEEAAKASAAIDNTPASTRTETVEVEEPFDEEESEDVIGSIIDEIAPTTVSDKPLVEDVPPVNKPVSIFD